VLNDLDTTLFTRLRVVTHYRPGLSRVIVAVLPSAILLMTLS
jgi:hypothetical protein